MDEKNVFESGVNYEGNQADHRVYTPSNNMNHEPEGLTLGEWIGTILLAMIPCAGIVLLFVWAFSSEEHPVRKKWAQAMLIVAAIGIALYLIVAISFGGALLSLISKRVYF